MLPLAAVAQSGNVVRGGCLPVNDDDAQENVAAARGRRPYRLTLRNDWDAQRTYRQAVVLVSFSDRDFSFKNPRETYDSIFNYPGYNQRKGPGCIAEYFREQSGGLFNVVFDVYGPYKVSDKAKINANADKSTHEYGTRQLLAATEQWIAEDVTRNHAPYDWNGDNAIDQVIYVYAGYGGNQDSQEAYGHIWPNTSAFSHFSIISTHDGYSVPNYTCSSELSVSGKSWGIGTICHEFSHSLGLPDIYPTNSNAGYSVVDEWDLMDGGNFTNGGWCPPNYSGLEKMLLGWLTPEELVEPQTITGMKPVSEGGSIYMVRHTDNEYLLLENRQWSGWDSRLPGRGLAIFHVDYNAASWTDNTLNGSRSHRRYQLVSADGRDYDAWDTLIGNNNPYVGGHNRYLSQSTYPWYDTADTIVTDGLDYLNTLPVLNRELTDTSNPAAVMFNTNTDGSKLLSKTITNITMSDDGLVSFDFGGTPTAVRSMNTGVSQFPAMVYDLSGHCVGRRLESQRPGLYIVRQPDGTVRKVVKR